MSSAQSKDLDGKVALITGANAGIGRVTAEVLARRGARVLLAGRSEARTQPVVDAIRAECGPDAAHYLALDLNSLKSVRACAEAVLARDEPLHMLINNAGLTAAGALTEEGFERTFGVNHLGHFLLTLLLMDRLKASAPARIVNVSSRSHYQAKKGIDFSLLKQAGSTTGLSEYAVSKLSNVLFSRELHKRLDGTGVTAYSLHPGVVATEIWRRIPFFIRWIPKLFMITPEQGAATTLHCATAEGVQSGAYYDDCKLKEPSRPAKDDALAAELWAKSLEWTGAPDLAASA
jgi:NAD(P)-dependent dehydrogenase (short-subunit alcohol dehydrogenase family)